MLRQNTINKKSPKLSLNMPCGGYFLLAWGKLQSVFCISNETPLEKMILSFEMGCQLENASGLGMGVQVHFPS